MASEGEIEMTRLAGKVTIVTGGASGMGRATVMRFLADGARVVVADLNEANGAETLAVAKANGHGNDIAFVRCDVAKEADVAATVAEAEKRFGRLDIAYLNAGVGGAFGPISETSVEDWDYTFAVLTRSVFLGMKHASLAIRKHGDGGVILVTASIAGMVGGGGSHAYSAAKAAVISLIENVAAELGPARPASSPRRWSIAGGLRNTRNSSVTSRGPTAASPTPSPTWRRSSFPTRRVSSPARPSRSTAAFWRRALRSGARARRTCS